MVKVKICGIKSKNTLEFLKNFSVDYVGFIMYPKSPRFAGDELKELLMTEIAAKKVVVFVNPDYQEVKKALDQGANLVQLHGKESLEFAKKVGLSRVIKAFRVENELPDEIKAWKEAYAILLDTYVKGTPGGTGQTFNWEIAKPLIKDGFKVFLAGGLNPENAPQAAALKPYALDINSGVEKAPGEKDPEKIKSLFKNLKGWNPSL